MHIDEYLSAAHQQRERLLVSDDQLYCTVRKHIHSRARETGITFVNISYLLFSVSVTVTESNIPFHPPTAPDLDDLSTPFPLRDIEAVL